MVAHQQYTRDFNNLLESFEALINFTQASFGYLLLLLDVLEKTFEELLAELISSQDKGETIENLRQFLQVWSSLSDRVFIQRFHSEDALEIQGKLINAALTWRSHQQQLMEVFLKMNDLPTRSELDEVYRSLYELRKEVKTLKKTLTQSPSDEVL
jgi:polyhydroxyalkanoate synthase subunit PhaE